MAGTGKLLALFFGLSMMVGPAAAQVADVDPEVLALALEDFRGDDLEGKDGPLSKVGFDLTVLYHEYQAYLQGGAVGPFTPHSPLTAVREDRVVIDAVANDAAGLLAELEAVGLIDGAHYGPMVSGWLPINAIPEMAALERLRLARPAAATTTGAMSQNQQRSPRGLLRSRLPVGPPYVGSVTSQGDAAQQSNVARSNLGVDGTGVTVGTLSDSYDCLGGAAADVASGDLPGVGNPFGFITPVIVLDDSACAATDEGRGMMQLIADVAPGAAQSFHTAFAGEASFALGIEELAGCPPGSGGGCTPSPVPAEVIVDDVFYFAEPFYQDGIIAQAVDGVVAAGHAYFSSAGNSARQAYESGAGFVPSGIAPPGAPLTTIAHDFDPGAGTDIFQLVGLATGTTIFSFQWNEPYASATGGAGATEDLDILLFTDPPGPGPIAGGVSFNPGGDPSEVFDFTNTGPPTLFNIVIVHDTAIPAASPPGKIKYVYFNGGSAILEYATGSGTVLGHSNAAGAEAVGAAFYFDTPPFGTAPPTIEPFSSAGPQAILFDLFDTPIPDPMRMKPEITAPDGGNTTFFGSDIADPGDGSDLDAFPNFFGTSAAAPHAAGVAALMLEASPALPPPAIYSALETTAIDMDDPFTVGFDTGFDFGTGYGLIDAMSAFDFLGSVTRFVSTTGSDAGNDCLNLLTPCLTIAHAVTVADPGDTLNIAAGTYAEPGLIDKALNIIAAGVIVE